MPVADTSVLLEGDSCYDCFGVAPGSIYLLKLALIRQWLLKVNPTAMTDAPSLLADATTACYDCYGPQSGLIELALLRKIAVALGVTGTDAATLLASAGCDDCYGNWPLVELGLLRAIVNK